MTAKADTNPLRECPFCEKPPGSKVGPPALVRCVTGGCPGNLLAAETPAQWNTRAALASEPVGAGEVVAWRYRWKIDGEWTNWRFANASQASRHLPSLEENPLYAAPIPADAARKLDAVVNALGIEDSDDDPSEVCRNFMKLSQQAIAAADGIEHLQDSRHLRRRTAEILRELVAAPPPQGRGAIAWMHSEHIAAYRAGKPDGIAWASPNETDFFDIALYAAPPAPGAADRAAVIEELRRVLREARRALDPDGDPIALPHRTLVAEINRVLAPANTGETER